jgi:crossover junction endodeoxyribonuclease RuvC
VRLIGLDPGLRHTGYGIVDVIASRLRHVADGRIDSGDGGMAERLLRLHDGVLRVIEEFRPDQAAVEETFVNRNPTTTLKLGLARGAVLLAPAKLGLPVSEYAPNQVKKTVVGVGHADKAQVEHMVRLLLPSAMPSSADAADALAVAICHAHHGATRMAWTAAALRVAGARL